MRYFIKLIKAKLLMYNSLYYLLIKFRELNQILFLLINWRYWEKIHEIYINLYNLEI